METVDIALGMVVVCAATTTESLTLLVEPTRFFFQAPPSPKDPPEYFLIVQLPQSQEYEGYHLWSLSKQNVWWASSSLMYHFQDVGTGKTLEPFPNLRARRAVKWLTGGTS